MGESTSESAISITSQRLSASSSASVAILTSFSMICSCEHAAALFLLAAFIFAVASFKFFRAASNIDFMDTSIEVVVSTFWDANDACALAAARRCLAVSVSYLPSDDDGIMGDVLIWR